MKTLVNAYKANSDVLSAIDLMRKVVYCLNLLNVEIQSIRFEVGKEIVAVTAVMPANLEGVEKRHGWYCWQIVNPRNRTAVNAILVSQERQT